MATHSQKVAAAAGLLAGVCLLVVTFTGSSTQSVDLMGRGYAPQLAIDPDTVRPPPPLREPAPPLLPEPPPTPCAVLAAGVLSGYADHPVQGYLAHEMGQAARPLQALNNHDRRPGGTSTPRSLPRGATTSRTRSRSRSATTRRRAPACSSARPRSARSLALVNITQTHRLFSS